MSTELMTATQSQHVFSSAAAYESAKLMAGSLANSTLVPKEYQKNIANSLIALEISQRIGASPLQVMQNLYIVHGRPSWSSQFVIAAINSCGRFKPLRFEFSGTEGNDNWACTAWTVERDVDLPKNIRTLQQAIDANLPILKSTRISIKMAKEEGWYSKTGSKWRTMPEQMMQYRSASFFGRIYAPDILMGMRSEDEVRDMIDVTPKEDSILNNLNDAIKESALKVTDVTEAGSPAPEPEPLKPTDSQASEQNVETAQAETEEVSALQSWIDDIDNAVNLEAVTFKFTQASKIFIADADAMAQLMIAKQERENALPKTMFKRKEQAA